MTTIEILNAVFTALNLLVFGVTGNKINGAAGLFGLIVALVTLVPA